jgi:hypothetical protein
MGVDGPVKYVATVDDQEYSVGLEEDGTLTLNGEPVAVDLQSIDGGFHYSLLAGTVSYELDSGENEKLNMGRLLSRMGKRPIYRFQQEVIPCSLVLYTTPRNYAHFWTD